MRVDSQSQRALMFVLFALVLGAMALAGEIFDVNEFGSPLGSLTMRFIVPPVAGLLVYFGISALVKRVRRAR